jgi:hypothetical protein
MKQYWPKFRWPSWRKRSCYVTGEQMESAIASAVKDAVDRMMKAQHERREAECFVVPWIGTLATMSCDSAEEVYRKTLRIMGVEGVNKIAAADLRSVVAMQPKPGVRGSRREAQDKWQEGWDRFYRRYPDAMRIRLT